MSSRGKGDKDKMNEALNAMLGGAPASDAKAAKTPPEAPSEKAKSDFVVGKPGGGRSFSESRMARAARTERTAVTTRLPRGVATDLSRVWVELRDEFPGLEKQDLLAAVLATYVRPDNLAALRTLVADWQRANGQGQT